MSFQRYSRTLTLPIIEGRVLVLNKQSDAPRSLQVRHLGKAGQTNPATIKMQESQDAVNWNDIGGTGQVIDAGNGTSLLITSNKPYVALAGYGNVDIEVEVNRSDPDSALPQTVNL